MKKAMFLTLMAILVGCNNKIPDESHSDVNGGGETEVQKNHWLGDPDFGGGASFKVPLPPGYDWEVTQSRYSDCEICSARYSDWDYCSLSHSFSCCREGIDFNLPGNADDGKPVLATADGSVRTVSYNEGWGNHVVIDHGDDICSRYAHLHDGSTSELVVGQKVCQGLQIGKIGNTGASEGSHLHFQFEKCSTGEGIAMSFTDGNGSPICTRGSDVYDENGNYDFLKLTNTLKTSCGSGGSNSNESKLPEDGWVTATCGSLPGCPLNKDCNRSGDYIFADHYKLSEREAAAVGYLWGECALDGKGDNKFHPDDNLTRAETLKFALFLFGLNSNCGTYEPFTDVNPYDWFFSVVVCAVGNNIITTSHDEFRPNEEVNFAEAARILVESAKKAGVIHFQQYPGDPFPNFPVNHWGYDYVETLYVYGGIENHVRLMHPDDKMRRGDFVVMAASLSPCFCGNVDCWGGCECVQEIYSCFDGNPTPGTGGSTPEVPEEPPPAETICEPSCDGKSCGPDGCGGNCGFCPLDHTCENGVCEVMACQPQNCFELGAQCGYLFDGCSDPIYCGECPSGMTCDEKNNCKLVEPEPTCEPSCDGKSCGPDGCGGDCGFCPFNHTCENGTCEVMACQPQSCFELGAQCGYLLGSCNEQVYCGECPYGTICDEKNNCKLVDTSDPPEEPDTPVNQGEWKCTPGEGYRLSANIPNAYYQTFSWSGWSDSKQWVQPGTIEEFFFDCQDLPASILIMNADLAQLWSDSAGEPPFMAWVPWTEDFQTINPSKAPDYVESYLKVTSDNFPIMIQVPAN